MHFYKQILLGVCGIVSCLQILPSENKQDRFRYTELSIKTPNNDAKPILCDYENDPGYYTSKAYFDSFEATKHARMSFNVKKDPIVRDFIHENIFTSEDLRNSRVSEKYTRRDKRTLVLKDGYSPIEGAVYLGIDLCHNEFEAYDKRGKHLGAIRPDTLKIYKAPVPGRSIKR